MNFKNFEVVEKNLSHLSRNMRLECLDFIIENPSVDVGGIVEHLSKVYDDVNRMIVSQALMTLRDIGLVHSVKRGRHRLYYPNMARIESYFGKVRELAENIQ